MDRIKSLNPYQIGILVFVAVMMIVFTIIYPITISRVGFEYKNAILIPITENESTVYSGKLYGKEAHFTVLPDNTVEFKHGDKSYGTYTFKKDPAAIPKDEELPSNMMGVEIKHNGEIMFRGGVVQNSPIRLLYNEDGSGANIGISVTVNGIETDAEGNVIDPAEPAAYNILDLMEGPEMTHKGEWIIWFFGILFCLIIVISVLYADELFRLSLSFRVQNADDAEPSEWEIAGRYIGWTVCSVITLVFFIKGLQ